MKRGRPLRPFSAKRAAEREARARLVQTVLERDGHRCTASKLVPSVECAGLLEVHEVIPRSAWAKGYLEPTNARTLCSAHHAWVGLHPNLAHALGLHGWSHERPDR